MRKRKIALFFLIAALPAAGFFLWYKSFNKNQVAASADIIFTIDVKKNRNTVLYHYLLHPSQWNAGSVFNRKKDTALNWQDAVTLPDYLVIFHSKGQPLTAWYCRLTIKDEVVLNKLLPAFHYIKGTGQTGLTEWHNDEDGIAIIQKENSLLIGTAAKNKQWLNAVATELFTGRQFIAQQTADTILSAKSHFSIFCTRNYFLENDVLLKGNLTNGRMRINGFAKINSGCTLDESMVHIADSSLLSMAFTQPPDALYKAVPAKIKTSLSAWMNFNVDSLFLSANKQYFLDVTSITARQDSAIGYGYDSNFNKVEKVIVNTVQEPSFACIITGKGPAQIFNYWQRNRDIETTVAGNLFTPVPFAKTYVHVLNDSLLLATENYAAPQKVRTEKAVACFSFCANLLPQGVTALLPDKATLLLKQINTCLIIVKKENGLLKIEGSVTTVKQERPFVISFE